MNPEEPSRAGVNNVVRFPAARRAGARGCPHCGTHTDFWRFGRLLWAYCDAHELRWVVADFGESAPGRIDRQQLRSRLEFLAAFAEVSR